MISNRHTILITGVNGFVGRSLCKAILDKGWHARGTLRSFKDAASLPSGINAIEIQPIGPNSEWANALFDVDIVVHLAARVHVINDKTVDPIAEFRKVNVAGTECLARMSAEAGVRRFIYLSSIKVNGEGSIVSYAENDIPAPDDPYGISKWETEQLLRRIEAETGLEVVILRPPLVYGPGVKANFLQMIEVVSRGIPLPLASIKNRRSLVYLGNLVDAIIACVEHPKAAGQTYLVSDGEDVSTPELIRRMTAALGKLDRLFPFPPAMMRLAGRLIGKSEAVEKLLGSLVVDSSKIRRELGWKPPYTMEEGLRETGEWFKSMSHAEARSNAEKGRSLNGHSA